MYKMDNKKEKPTQIYYKRVLLNGTSRCIYLPHKWLKDNNIKDKDNLKLEAYKGKLVISVAD